MVWSDDLVFKIPLSMDEKEGMLKLEDDIRFAKSALSELKKINIRDEGNSEFKEYKNAELNVNSLINALRYRIETLMGYYYTKYGTHE